jgi:hypothetical protein
VAVDNLVTLVRAKPSGPVTTKLNWQISKVVSRTAKGTESDALAPHSTAGPGSRGDNRNARVQDGQAASSGATKCRAVGADQDAVETASAPALVRS